MTTAGGSTACGREAKIREIRRGAAEQDVGAQVGGHDDDCGGDVEERDGVACGSGEQEQGGCSGLANANPRVRPHLLSATQCSAAQRHRTLHPSTHPCWQSTTKPLQKDTVRRLQHHPPAALAQATHPCWQRTRCGPWSRSAARRPARPAAGSSRRRAPSPPRQTGPRSRGGACALEQHSSGWQARAAVGTGSPPRSRSAPLARAAREPRARNGRRCRHPGPAARCPPAAPARTARPRSAGRPPRARRSRGARRSGGSRCASPCTRSCRCCGARGGEAGVLDSGSSERGRRLAVLLHALAHVDAAARRQGWMG